MILHRSCLVVGLTLVLMEDIANCWQVEMPDVLGMLFPFFACQHALGRLRCSPNSAFRQNESTVKLHRPLHLRTQMMVGVIALEYLVEVLLHEV